MQLRHETKLTSWEYVTEEGWRQASLKRCPRHPDGACRLARHGSYPRSEPPGMRVARWYCLDAQTTFSLLPDCLAARVSGSLDEVEEVVVKVEASSSVEAAASKLRPDIDLAGAVRWVRRRLVGVRVALVVLITLVPGTLGTRAELEAIRTVLSTDRALVALRGIGASHLGKIVRPLGFGPRHGVRGEREGRSQHETGPDPPS